MNLGQVILAIIGLGIIAVGLLILAQLRAKQPNAGGEIIVREEGPVQPWLPVAWWNGAPYYSHVPMRPLMY